MLLANSAKTVSFVLLAIALSSQAMVIPKGEISPVESDANGVVNEASMENSGSSREVARGFGTGFGPHFPQGGLKRQFGEPDFSQGGIKRRSGESFWPHPPQGGVKRHVNSAPVHPATLKRDYDEDGTVPANTDWAVEPSTISGGYGYEDDEYVWAPLYAPEGSVPYATSEAAPGPATSDVVLQPTTESVPASTDYESDSY